MKRFSLVTIVWSLLALTVTSAIPAEQNGPKFRPNVYAYLGISPLDPEDGATPLNFKRTPDIPLRDAYIDAHAMKNIGGILFMGEAHPSADAPKTCPSLRIDLGKPTGNRLIVRFSNSKEVRGEIFDWELVPTANLVKTGEDGLFSHMGSEPKWQDDFKYNLAGVNLFLLDLSLTWKSKFPRAHLLFVEPIPGYPQIEPSAENYEAWKTLYGFLQGAQQLMFFDRDVDFNFSTENGTLKITGTPYWAVVTKKDAAGNGRIVREFKNVELARLTNPTIYDSIYRVAKYAAFFRYMAHKCRSEWGQFLTEVSTKREKMRLEPVEEKEFPGDRESWGDDR